MARPPKDPVIRFAQKITVIDGCWVWGGYLNLGYGKFWDGKKSLLVHRWSYQYFVGPIPEGLVLDHLCRNRSCVNPDHLEPVSSGQNLLRSEITSTTINKKKTACIHGHEFTVENTFINKSGHRACRACVYRRNRQYYKERKDRKELNGEA